MRLTPKLCAVALACLAGLAASQPAAFAGLIIRNDLERANSRLAGHIVDYTRNHGADRRLWSPALCACRDLYVYLPPCYDPNKRYPVLLWLHGILQDEKSFVTQVAPKIDAAIVACKLPPMIVAAPDGGIPRDCFDILHSGSFYINSKAGNYEDYVIHDVWQFVTSHYPVRPEREAHVIAGVSMGGFAAYNLGIKHRDMFKIVVGLFPPLNMRWVDCHGRYMRNFDPECWGWRTDYDRGRQVVGRFFAGLFIVRLKQVIDPLFGRGPEARAGVSRENPIEMIDAYGLREGDLHMYAAYGGRDEFNIDAQVESFLYRAHERGLTVAVGYDPKGRHNISTAYRLLPGIFDWLTPLLAPYAPCAGVVQR